MIEIKQKGSINAALFVFQSGRLDSNQFISL